MEKERRQSKSNGIERKQIGRTIRPVALFSYGACAPIGAECLHKTGRDSAHSSQIISSLLRES